MCIPGDENGLVPVKMPAEESLPLHPRLRAKGLGGLLSEVKAKLLQSPVTVATSEQKTTGNVTPPRVFEEPEDEETRDSCLLQSAELETEETAGGSPSSTKESLERGGEHPTKELSPGVSMGETCEMGNSPGCCMETRQDTQNEDTGSMEEMRQKTFLFPETGGGGLQQTDNVVVPGRREGNGENDDDVQQGQDCPGQGEVGGDETSSHVLLPEEFLQALLPTRHSVLESFSSLENYLCEHVYGLLSRCRALPGEAHEKVGKTKKGRKTEATPKFTAERQRQREPGSSHQNHDTSGKGGEGTDKQEEKNYKERNQPPPFRGAIRATQHLLETDAW